MKSKRKLTKGNEKAIVTQGHPRNRNSADHEKWRKTIKEAMRRGRDSRRAAGYLTATQLSVEVNWPLYTLRRMIADGQIRTVKIAGRMYVPLSEATRFKTEIA